MKTKKISTRKEVVLENIKKLLSDRIVKDYGSVNKFSLHEDAAELGVHKSVKTILSRGGKNSLVVMNKLLAHYKMPLLVKKEEITKVIRYYKETV